MNRTARTRTLAAAGVLALALSGLTGVAVLAQPALEPQAAPPPAEEANQPAPQLLLPGQPPPPAPAAPAAGQPADQAAPPAVRQTFSQAELDEMLAPVALYPDSLLSQVLMASTYPVEVVQADRWRKGNPDLGGDQLADALEQQPWDPSVKSLVNSPDVLAMMSDKLDWTVRLGDAFIGQQQQVMDTVQDLRRRAQEQGTLKDTPEQRVRTLVQAEPVVQREIIIEQADPDVIYVPVYDPYVAYGTWWHPHHRPFFWCPPTYPRNWFGVWYGLSYRCGPAWGYAWGHPDWNHHRFTVDVHRHERFNSRIDRARFNDQLTRRDDAFHVSANTWVHDPSHRRGVWYRDSNVAQRFGAPTPPQLGRNQSAIRTRAGGDARLDTSFVGPRITTPSNPDRKTNDTLVTNEAREKQRQQQDVRTRSPVQAPGLTRDDADSARRNARGRDNSANDDTDLARVQRARQAPGLTRDDAIPARGNERVRTRDDNGADNDRIRQQIQPSDRARVARPDVSRDRGAAFSEVDRDGGSVRSESRRGSVSRGPSDSFRSEPAPRASSPSPSFRSSPSPSRAGGDSDGGGGGRGGGGGDDGGGRVSQSKSSPAPAATHGNTPRR